MLAPRIRTLVLILAGGAGGLLILQPRLGHDDREGFQHGTADSLWRNAPLIREFAPEALVVLSADAVYAQDYGALVEAHVASGAPLTMATYEVDPGDAGRYGATVVRAVLDDHVDVRAAVGEPDGEIALAGCGATVETDVPAGGRYPDVTP